MWWWHRGLSNETETNTTTVWKCNTCTQKVWGLTESDLVACKDSWPVTNSFSSHYEDFRRPLPSSTGLKPEAHYLSWPVSGSFCSWTCFSVIAGRLSKKAESWVITIIHTALSPVKGNLAIIPTVHLATISFAKTCTMAEPLSDFNERSNAA